MLSKSEAILSSHRDAATRVINLVAKKHKLSLKPNDALEVVAVALGAANWKTLRAMAEQGRAPRMLDVAQVAAEPAAPLVSPVPPASLAHALFKAPDLATLRAKVSMGDLPPERALAAYDFVVNLEQQNRHMPTPSVPQWEAYVEEASNVLGIQLSEGQSMAIDSLAKFKFSILAGPTGSGKATSMKVFAGAMRCAGCRVLDLTHVFAMESLRAALSSEHAVPGKLPFDVVLMDERAFESPDTTYALQHALPEACRIVIVVDTDKHRLFAHIVRLLKSVKHKSVMVEFNRVFRQTEPARVKPLSEVVSALHARLGKTLPALPLWDEHRKAMYASGNQGTDAQCFAFDTFSRSALTFVSSDEYEVLNAQATVKLYASQMRKAGCQVLDLATNGMHPAEAELTSADVLVLDENAFEGTTALTIFSQMLPFIKPTCRVIVLFKEWWPTSPGVKEMLQVLHESARKHIAAMLFRTGGEVRMR